MLLVKRKPHAILTITPRSLLIVAIGLLLLITGYYVYVRAYTPQHCVTEVQPEGSTAANTLEYRCFTTQVEAIKYATGGKINLPPDASQSDIDNALRHQTP